MFRRPGRHEVEVAPAGAELQSFDVLACPVLAQRRDRHGVQGHRPASLGCLMRAEVDLVLNRYDGLSDRGAARVEVDVGPPQAQSLRHAACRRSPAVATPRAGGRRRVPSRNLRSSSAVQVAACYRHGSPDHVAGGECGE